MYFIIIIEIMLNFIEIMLYIIIYDYFNIYYLIIINALSLILFFLKFNILILKFQIHNKFFNFLIFFPNHLQIL